MNGDMISRSALIRKVFPYGMPDDGNYPINAKAVMKAVADAEGVEAEPVIHAYWKLRGGLFRCTRCDAKALWSKNGGTHGYSYEYEQVKANRCHVCGAHMDEEVADA